MMSWKNHSKERYTASSSISVLILDALLHFGASQDFRRSTSSGYFKSWFHIVIQTIASLQKVARLFYNGKCSRKRFALPTHFSTFFKATFERKRERDFSRHVVKKLMGWDETVSAQVFAVLYAKIRRSRPKFSDDGSVTSWKRHNEIITSPSIRDTCLDDGYSRSQPVTLCSAESHALSFLTLTSCIGFRVHMRRRRAI